MDKVTLDYSKLPKSEWFSVAIVHRSFGPWWLYTRVANAAVLYAGPFHAVWRMPWIPHVAAALHPEAIVKREPKT